MIILVTNDDGIDSPGLDAMRNALTGEHEVWTVAPESERSATSHYITIKDPIRCKELDERLYACSGSPADCVIVSALGGLPFKPDLVIAGINIGPNIGTDIIYSGTVAAARQAAFMGIPGIAVSINTFVDPFHFGPLTRFVAEHLDDLCALWNPRHLININGPNIDSNDLPVEVTYPCWRVYNDDLVQFESPRGEMFFFLTGQPAETELEEGSDWHAVESGAISVSPIYLNPIDHHEDEAYRNALFLKAEV